MRAKAYNSGGGTAIAGYSVECPACKAAGFGSRHMFAVRMRDGSPGWDFNGNFDLPTFSPSMLATTPSNGRIPEEKFICHSFVTDGKIQYLADCTHAMAGQTVDLPEIDE